MNTNGTAPKANPAPAGNVYDKYHTPNPLARYLMSGFTRSFDEMVSMVPCEEALEVGCGEGELIKRLTNRRRPNLIAACDISSGILAKARENAPKSGLACASVERLPYPDNAFDLVIACEVLEHVENPYLALREIARVTRRAAILSVPREPLWRALNVARGAYLSDMGNTPGHIQHWSASSFKATVAMALRVRTIRKPLPWTMILAEKRYENLWNLAPYQDVAAR